MAMDETAKLLRKLQADKKRFGTHPCCAKLVTGPHGMECPTRLPEGVDSWYGGPYGQE